MSHHRWQDLLDITGQQLVLAMKHRPCLCSTQQSKSSAGGQAMLEHLRIAGEFEYAMQVIKYRIRECDLLNLLLQKRMLSPVSPVKTRFLPRAECQQLQLTRKQRIQQCRKTHAQS